MMSDREERTMQYKPNMENRPPTPHGKLMSDVVNTRKTEEEEREDKDHKCKAREREDLSVGFLDMSDPPIVHKPRTLSDRIGGVASLGAVNMWRGNLTTKHDNMEIHHRRLRAATIGKN